MSESQLGQPSGDSRAESPRRPVDLDGEAQMRVAGAPFLLSQEPVTEPDAAPTPMDGATEIAPAYEHLGELPTTYGTQSVYLVAYDPHRLFAYWDVDWSATPGQAYSLHLCRADGTLEERLDIAASEGSRYLPIAVPGATYFVELGTYGRDGRWSLLATSARATLPPESLAGESEPRFATLPFHLSFQRLMELIQGGMRQGEDLTAALARLQQSDVAGAATLSRFLSDIGPEQLRTLELVLGQKLSVSSAGDSEAPLLRDRYEALGAGAFSSGAFSSEEVTAHAAGASESLSSAGLITPIGGESSESALSSAELVTAAGAIGSETFLPGPLVGETLSSGAFGSEMLASGALAAFVAGMSSETLASFLGPATSSEAWRLAGAFGPGGSEVWSSERAADLRRAFEHNLDVLGSLFSAVNASLGGDSSPGGSSDSFGSASW